MNRKLQRFAVLSTILCCAVVFAVAQNVSAAVVVNGGFEDPDILNGSYQYPLAGGSIGAWNVDVFGAGLSDPPSGFGSIPAPEGEQYAFLQANGAMSQDISVNLGDLVWIDFMAAGRVPGATFGGSNLIEVLLDGILVWSGTPVSGVFNSYQTTPIVAAATTLTLEFRGGSPGVDVTSFVDDVSVTAVVPEPATVMVWSLLALCGLGLTYWRRRQAA